ncbi:hypothetical protein DFR70_12525 [Nocardia tenerifensis]|uniref:Uncharacterized protein n=1 Tax=Nocardia tenerifensis TaxID=228006 RepID=A0A318JSK7_9NOCA|nr:hypothetical protein [Nocardia tenerifensis]PXX54044.1 hypothetical protein DFR70_12525 [Nocardia tenerifensis]
MRVLRSLFVIVAVTAVLVVVGFVVRAQAAPTPTPGVHEVEVTDSDEKLVKQAAARAKSAAARADAAMKASRNHRL